MFTPLAHSSINTLALIDLNNRAVDSSWSEGESNPCGLHSNTGKIPESCISKKKRGSRYQNHTTCQMMLQIRRVSFSCKTRLGPSGKVGLSCGENLNAPSPQCGRRLTLFHHTMNPQWQHASVATCHKPPLGVSSLETFMCHEKCSSPDSPLK